ncbi:MAG: SufE family protein [Ignavibacteriales bacterium]|nr:SufE family protein [Ignavibacteriales bacterium]
MEETNGGKYPVRLHEFLEIIEYYDNFNDRINFLIDYAEKFKRVPENISVKPYPPENKVEYCESGAYVWTLAEPNSTFKFYFDVENPHGISAMALAKIFDDTLSGETEESILSVPDDIVYKIFGQSLSMGKNLGLTGILLAMKRDVKNFRRMKNVE